MKNIQIITDSSADLSKELVEKYGIDVVPFYVSFREETYLKEGEEIPQKDFYDQLVSSEANPKQLVHLLMIITLDLKKLLRKIYQLFALLFLKNSVVLSKVLLMLKI